MKFNKSHTLAVILLSTALFSADFAGVGDGDDVPKDTQVSSTETTEKPNGSSTMSHKAKRQAKKAAQIGEAGGAEDPVGKLSITVPSGATQHATSSQEGSDSPNSGFASANSGGSAPTSPDRSTSPLSEAEASGGSQSPHASLTKKSPGVRFDVKESPTSVDGDFRKPPLSSTGVQSSDTSAHISSATDNPDASTASWIDNMTKMFEERLTSFEGRLKKGEKINASLFSAELVRPSSALAQIEAPKYSELREQMVRAGKIFKDASEKGLLAYGKRSEDEVQKLKKEIEGRLSKVLGEEASSLTSAADELALGGAQPASEPTPSLTAKEVMEAANALLNEEGAASETTPPLTTSAGERVTDTREALKVAEEFLGITGAAGGSSSEGEGNQDSNKDAPPASGPLTSTGDSGFGPPAKGSESTLAIDIPNPGTTPNHVACVSGSLDSNLETSAKGPFPPPIDTSPGSFGGGPDEGTTSPDLQFPISPHDGVDISGGGGGSAYATPAPSPQTEKPEGATLPGDVKSKASPSGADPLSPHPLGEFGMADTINRSPGEVLGNGLPNPPMQAFPASGFVQREGAAVLADLEKRSDSTTSEILGEASGGAVEGSRPPSALNFSEGGSADGNFGGGAKSVAEKLPSMASTASSASSSEAPTPPMHDVGGAAKNKGLANVERHKLDRSLKHAGRYIKRAKLLTQPEAAVDLRIRDQLVKSIKTNAANIAKGVKNIEQLAQAGDESARAAMAKIISTEKGAGVNRTLDELYDALKKVRQLSNPPAEVHPSEAGGGVAVQQAPSVVAEGPVAEAAASANAAQQQQPQQPAPNAVVEPEGNAAAVNVGAGENGDQPAPADAANPGAAAAAPQQPEVQAAPGDEDFFREFWGMFQDDAPQPQPQPHPQPPQGGGGGGAPAPQQAPELTPERDEQQRKYDAALAARASCVDEALNQAPQTSMAVLKAIMVQMDSMQAPAAGDSNSTVRFSPWVGVNGTMVNSEYDGNKSSYNIYGPSVGGSLILGDVGSVGASYSFLKKSSDSSASTHAFGAYGKYDALGFSLHGVGAYIKSDIAEGIKASSIAGLASAGYKLPVLPFVSITPTLGVKYFDHKVEALGTTVDNNILTGTFGAKLSVSVPTGPVTVTAYAYAGGEYDFKRGVNASRSEFVFGDNANFAVAERDGKYGGNIKLGAKIEHKNVQLGLEHDAYFSGKHKVHYTTARITLSL